MKRQIIHIDQEKCNGCGACAAACHEGALQLIDGKARLVTDSYCDGLGACLPACPADAIFVEGASNSDTERFSPGERYGRVYQINYLRCIFCGMCIEACPTRALTMTNDFKLANRSREVLIYEKDDLLAPLVAGMEQPPHPRRLGNDEKDYFLGLPPTGQPDTRTSSMTNQGGAK